MFERTRFANVREKLLGIVTECWKVGELTTREFETAKRLINVGEGEEGINALNNVDDPRLAERLQMERKLEYLLDEAEDVRKLYEHTVQVAEQKLEELAERLSVLGERTQKKWKHITIGGHDSMAMGLELESGQGYMPVARQFR